MKKVVSLLLALVLMVGLLFTAAFADEEEMSDTITFEQVKSKTSDNGLFTLTATDVNESGWRSGFDKTLTITAANGLIITRIEAELDRYSSPCDGLNASGDAIIQSMLEKDGVKIVSITNINSSEFSITGGIKLVEFKNITVYYTGTRTHSYGENNVCVGCGLTKCKIEGHTLENGFCKFCDYFDATKHTHDFIDGVCKCGTACQHEEPVTEVVSAEKKYCPDCGKVISLTEITNPEKNASVLSKGYPEIVLGVGGVALGLVGGLLIGKKKKAPAANGSEKEDEE